MSALRNAASRATRFFPKNVSRLARPLNYAVSVAAGSGSTSVHPRPPRQGDRTHARHARHTGTPQQARRRDFREGMRPPRAILATVVVRRRFFPLSLSLVPSFVQFA